VVVRVIVDTDERQHAAGTDDVPVQLVRAVPGGCVEPAGVTDLVA
jgi:hypothetical protein